MRALWSDRQNCSHNVSQKVKRTRRLSDMWEFRSRNLLRKDLPLVFWELKGHFAETQVQHAGGYSCKSGSFL